MSEPNRLDAADLDRHISRGDDPEPTAASEWDYRAPWPGIVHEAALRDPVFRTKRRRWIARWRKTHRGGCDWCMGHTIPVTLIEPRADGGGTIMLELPNGVSLLIDSRHPGFWDLKALHESLLRNPASVIRHPQSDI